MMVPGGLAGLHLARHHPKPMTLTIRLTLSGPHGHAHVYVHGYVRSALITATTNDHR